ncbi:BamA/TamA family outer membrane protein [Ferrimonas aestuarii]|uniref:Surface antigen n=1 Tax=Ferrimonas aestuarii TaxID=2569539 RepID=A0A4U1BQ23_9GAMM|nr:hypothetical protein [Ferrimonas aestuarii]TKB56699.1 hypothetical protein FCL42_06085 [Ferrimonas aestuarii]
MRSLSIFALAILPLPLLANEGISDNAPDTSVETAQAAQAQPGKRNAVVPFLFSSTSMGTTLAAAGSFRGIFQPQAQLIAVGAYSNNDSYIAYGGLHNLSFGPKRWKLDLEAFSGTFKESEVYLNGSHNSEQQDYVTGEEHQERYSIHFRYLLPLGAGADASANRRQAFSPMPPQSDSVSHQSPTDQPWVTLGFKPFYYTATVADFDEEKTAGLELKLDVDARNYVPSPSSGYRFEVDMQRDWGADDRDSYTNWQAQYSQYFDLGVNQYSKQQTLSLTAYLADTPTWDKDNNTHQAPYFAQNRLGGWDRLRGYTANRFHDRSAIFYGAEYRATPNYQPQSQIPFINRYQMPWWQWSLFAGVGRVHDEFDLGELHQDLKWSAGFGARLWVENVLVRMDIGYSEEGNQVRVVVNQPF